MIRIFSALIFLLLLSNVSISAPGAFNNSKTVVKIPRSDDYVSEDFKFTLGFKTSYSVQAQEQDNNARSQSIGYSLNPGFSAKGYSFYVNLNYDQDLIDRKKSYYSDPGFNLSRRSWAITDYLNLKPSGSLVLPMTDKAKNVDGLLYNIGAGLSLSLNSKYLNMDEWDFSAGVAINRNFTKYDTNSYGEPSNAYRIKQSYRGAYDITDNLSISTSLSYTSYYSVNDIVTNTFNISETLSYKYDRSMSFNVGHSNGGPTLTPITYDDNLKVYDEKGSSYSVGLSLKL